MADPSFGFRTFKGRGSPSCVTRTTTGSTSEVRERHVRLEEGPAVHRHYAYQEKGVNGAQHLYRHECIRLKGLDALTTAFGRTNEEARDVLYDELKRKGVMPAGEAQ
jgi:hypothetical protein